MTKSAETYIADEGVIQLEDQVSEAAKEVERCDAAHETAKNKVEQIERQLFEVEADLQEAEEARQKIDCERLAAYWTLGRAITDLEAALAANKGKHSENTPRKRAIELAGNNARYQRAKAISSHFECRADAEEAAMTRSLNDILKESAEKKAEDRKAKGQEAPGRKPSAKTNTKVVTPVTRKAQASEVDETVADDESVAENEEPEISQSSITADEVKAVESFVTSVGGWNRATYLIEECYTKWLQNQTN